MSDLHDNELPKALAKAIKGVMGQNCVYVCVAVPRDSANKMIREKCLLALNMPSNWEACHILRNVIDELEGRPIDENLELRAE